MAYNPNLTSISHSRINDYNRCPQLYFLRNVYRENTHNYKIQVITPPLALGSVVHDIIDGFLNYEVEKRTKPLLYALFKRHWEGVSGKRGGFKSAEMEEEYKQRAINMLRNFVNNEEFVKRIRLKTSQYPKFDLGDDIVVNGRLDWFGKVENGYEIVDFKTGKNKEKANSLQMPIYSLIVESEFKVAYKASNVIPYYWYLDSETVPVKYELPDKEEVLETLKIFGSRIKLAHQLNSFKCQSGEEYCRYCSDFIRVINGEGEMVKMDQSRSQVIYIIPDKKEEELTLEEELPF